MDRVLKTWMSHKKQADDMATIEKAQYRCATTGKRLEAKSKLGTKRMIKEWKDAQLSI